MMDVVRFLILHTSIAAVVSSWRDKISKGKAKLTRWPRTANYSNTAGLPICGATPAWTCPHWQQNESSGGQPNHHLRITSKTAEDGTRSQPPAHVSNLDSHSTPSTSVSSEALSKLIHWGPTYPFHAGRVGRAWTTPVVLGRHTWGPGLSRHRRAHLILQNTFHFMAVGKMGISSGTAPSRFLLHQRK